MRAQPDFACRRLLAAALLAVYPTGAPGQIVLSTTGATRATQIAIDHAVADASRRFGIPIDWIRRIMRTESGGNPSAVSRAGALGLMQLMPKTYAELLSRYDLGADPFDISDNVMAGAAYLRELYDRFGARGMLAAYNAGPARWQDHIGGGRPLPGETILYLAKLGPMINPQAAGKPSVGPPRAMGSSSGDLLFAVRRAGIRPTEGEGAAQNMPAVASTNFGSRTIVDHSPSLSETRIASPSGLHVRRSTPHERSPRDLMPPPAGTLSPPLDALFVVTSGQLRRAQ